MAATNNNPNNAFYKLFNSQVTDLLEEMMRVCPTVIKIKEISIMFNVTKNINPKIPLETFTDHILAKFNVQLRSHDESFFLAHDFGEDVPSASWGKIVNMLRQLWKTNLGPDSKAAMWQYIDNLVALSDRVKAVA